MESPTVNKTAVIEKFPGKGGWSFVRIPEIPQDRHQYFGWVRVNGSVDDYPLTKYNLMPMGDGHLFLPINAAIRKSIKKEVGDAIKVILYLDQTPKEIPKELLECFENESSDLLIAFNKLRPKQRSTYLDSIYGAKTEEIKAQRIVKLMEDLQGKK